MECRLTKKFGDKVEIPMSPMIIEDCDDRDEYFKIQKEVEDITVRLAEYEDIGSVEEFENLKEKDKWIMPGETVYMVDDDFREFEETVKECTLANDGTKEYSTGCYDFNENDIGEWVFKCKEDRARALE